MGLGPPELVRDSGQTVQGRRPIEPGLAEGGAAAGVGPHRGVGLGYRGEPGHVKTARPPR